MIDAMKKKTEHNSIGLHIMCTNAISSNFHHVDTGKTEYTEGGRVAIYVKTSLYINQQ